MKYQLEDIKKSVDREIDSISDLSLLDEVRIKYLGRKGILTLMLRSLKDVNPSERSFVGKTANQLKEHITLLLQEKTNFLKHKADDKASEETLDISLPGKSFSLGKLHPLTRVNNQLIDIFVQMGFSVAQGPEAETDYYNFEALNIASDHPARDMWSTLYLTDHILLRTHTSPVQIRVMEKQLPPVRIIAPGKVFRHDLDISHSPMFHQIEGLWVDKNVTFSDLKGVLKSFAKQMFDPDISVRFRPSFFPFTEPSLEMDIGCVMCNEKGCRICKDTGWLEILGAGMVHPQVLKNVGYNTDEVNGYAFGMGVERITMLKYGISDIRLFFENDLRFLRQF